MFTTVANSTLLANFAPIFVTLGAWLLWRHRVSGAFLVGYGFFRFVAEFARQPDDFLGLLRFGLSMGQWLSAPMILAGAVMMVWAYRRAPAVR